LIQVVGFLEDRRGVIVTDDDAVTGYEGVDFSISETGLGSGCPKSVGEEYDSVHGSLVPRACSGAPAVE
jgi:hypothetical protein